VPPTSPSPDLAARRDALALAALPNVGGARFRELVARFGSAERALTATADPGRRAAAATAAERVLLDAERCGADVWIAGTPPYPPQLFDLPDPPPHLFAVGAAEVLEGPLVAVVGTRSATAYGERVTRELAGALARAGACIVSGLARGIDAAAHVAALEVGGRTVAVLGTGIDVPYPTMHAALHTRIAERGLVLSEHPPGARATPGSFPRRNRVIAALAQVTIVVEAGAKSGALITAGHALDLGRTVAAVPGPIDTPQAAGSNELLRDGAVVIATLADALALAGVAGPRPAHAGTLAPDEQRVWDLLATGPLDLDTLLSKSALPVPQCLGAITTLELAGLVECALTGEIRRR
jgi:DNA processing protein